MNDIKNLLSKNGLLDKIVDKMIVKSIDDTKMDGIVFKYLDKNVYKITNDVVFKQCSKCKEFKEINQFSKLSKTSNCLFNKNYFCRSCIKLNRPIEKERQYYLTRCKKINPDYIPLTNRMTIKKQKELEKAEKEKLKLESIKNLANTNIPIDIKLIEKVINKEVNKIVPVKDLPVEIKLEEKKQRKTKKSDNTPIVKPSHEAVKSEVSVKNQQSEIRGDSQNSPMTSIVSESVQRSNKRSVRTKIVKA